MDSCNGCLLHSKTNTAGIDRWIYFRKTRSRKALANFYNVKLELFTSLEVNNDLIDCTVFMFKNNIMIFYHGYECTTLKKYDLNNSTWSELTIAFPIDINNMWSMRKKARIFANFDIVFCLIM